MVKILVSLDDMLLKSIDSAARASGRSRSEYLVELAESDIADRFGFGEVPDARAALRKLDSLFASAQAEDSTAAMRAMRDAR